MWTELRFLNCRVSKVHSLGRADQLGEIRGAHEGRAERHVLHHWREHRRRVPILVLGKSAQEGSRGTVHCVLRGWMCSAQAQEIRRTEAEFHNGGGLHLGNKMRGKRFDELNAEFDPLTKLEEAVGDKVETEIVSDRVVDSRCVVTTSEL